MTRHPSEIAEIESIPKFTAPAAKLWAAIPGDSKKLLLSNVWCGKCRDETTIYLLYQPAPLKELPSEIHTYRRHPSR